MEEKQQQLIGVYSTLCNIDIRGEKNIENMYACISTLKNVIAYIEMNKKEDVDNE